MYSHIVLGHACLCDVAEETGHKALVVNGCVLSVKASHEPGERHTERAELACARGKRNAPMNDQVGLGAVQESGELRKRPVMSLNQIEEVNSPLASPVDTPAIEKTKESKQVRRTMPTARLYCLNCN